VYWLHITPFCHNIYVHVPAIHNVRRHLLLSWPKFFFHDSSPCVIHCLPLTFPTLFAQISYALAAQSSTNVNLFFIALALLPGKMIFFSIRRTTNSYLQTLFSIWHLQMLYMLPSPPKLLLLLLHRLISYNLYIEHYYLHCFKIFTSSLKPT